MAAKKVVMITVGGAVVVVLAVLALWLGRPAAPALTKTYTNPACILLFSLP